MSAPATMTARLPAERLDRLAVYRDDGPIARALGRAAGPAAGLRAPALGAAAALPLLALIAVGGESVSHSVAGAAVAWLVVCGGLSSGSHPGGRLRWTVLPALRLCEYAALLWFAALAGSSAFPAAFAVLAAVVFHHYDLMYRLRLRGTTPAPWVKALSVGWDGRLVAGYLLLVAGALPGGFYVLAALLGVAFVGESVASWLTFGREQQAPVYEDEEEDAE
jgi:hypothetical protein